MQGAGRRRAVQLLAVVPGQPVGLGHANIAITMDRYGHLMPGNESEAAELLDAFLLAH